MLLAMETKRRADIVRKVISGGWLVVAMAAAAWANAASDSELAQELTNPVADLVSVPIQMNFDDDVGPGDRGSKLTTNIQPVIPFDVNEDWNLISRTILPVIYQDDVIPGTGSQFGLGDVNLSLFFSPKKPSSDGVIWGRGRSCCSRRPPNRNSGQRNGAQGPPGW